MNILRQSILAAATAVLIACTGQPATHPSGPAKPATTAISSPEEKQRLHELFDAYFEEYLELFPLAATSIGDPRFDDRFAVSISPEWRTRFQRSTQTYLERIKAIDPRKLDDEDRISYDIFRLAREMDLEGLRFPTHLIPLNQFYSMTNTFVQLGSGNGMQPFKTVKNYEAFLKRFDGLLAWTDQAMANMREGSSKGYTLPRVLAERVLPQLASQVVKSPEESSFWGPIKNIPAGFSASDRERLTAAYRAMIETKVVPTYRKLHDFLRDEYVPKCRDTVGLGALADGQAWYAFNIREITTTEYTPEQIHHKGLEEVARIQGEIRKVMEQVGFKGDLHAFFTHMKTDPNFFYESPEALIQGYVELKRRVAPELPKLFEIFPKADYEVRPVEPFREKSAAGGFYQAASEDGSRLGIFFANTYNIKTRPKWAMTALSLHEANPGHHFQMSIQREQKALPKFRRFGRYTAYGEGWGLYSESLGMTLGFYKEPYAYFGMLDAELLRAIRLVVDTGLHSKGWTRQQVLDYMEANGASGESERVAEAERYMAIPGQALAYKLGQLKIQELRGKAERALGPQFDVRKFHTAVLIHGGLPLNVLEAEVDRFIAAQRDGRVPSGQGGGRSSVRE